MKQFKLTFLLTILMSMVGVKSFAYDAENDGIYYNFSETEATVGQGSNCSGDLPIPESVTYNGKTYSVTSIEWRAFDNCEGLTSITCHATIPPSCGPHVFGVDKSALSLRCQRPALIFTRLPTSGRISLLSRQQEYKM